MAGRLNVREHRSRHGLKPKSSWSQNFLVDLDVLQSIAEAAQAQGRVVVELGAGLGALTSQLAQLAQRVVAVERDRELAVLLRAEFSDNSQVEILEANAATLHWSALVDELQARPVVVGNLPYHMATPILFHLIEAKAHLSSWLLMFQDEMALRMLAGPGSRTYGVLSVMVQQHTEVESVLKVGPDSFFPAPKVNSRVLRFRPLARPRVAVKDEKMFERVVRAAFGQRRKKIRNGLLSVWGRGHQSDRVDRALALASVDGSLRAEQFSMEEFGRLADALYELEVEERLAAEKGGNQ